MATTQLICTTNAFTSSDTSTTMTPVIVINSQTVSHSLSLQTKPSVMAVTSMSPTVANPVLNTDVTLTITSTFPYTLNRDDFTFEAEDTNNTNYRRQLKVNTVDDSAKTLTGKFQGAESGQFKINLRHATYGLIDSSALELDVNSYVTSYSPTTGSIYGGTLITIQGTNFGTEATDNPVKLFGTGTGTGVDCFVETSSATQITCRLDSVSTNETNGQTASMIVFLKLSEEANCSSSVCFDTYTYNDNIPVIQNVTLAFDTSVNDWVVTVDGTSFTGSASTTTYAVNGVNQETLSVSSTQAKFRLSNVTSQHIQGAKLLFDVGKPENHTLIEASMIISPKLQGFSPQVGSVHGQVIHMNAPGLTVGDDLSLTKVVKYSDTSKTNVCQTIEIPEQGVLLCLMSAGQVFSNQSNEYLAIEQSVSYESFFVLNTTSWTLLPQTTVSQSGMYGCATSSDCQYTAWNNGSFPVLNSTSKSDDSNLVLTGSGFQFTSGITPNVSYAGVWADSVTVNSDTQATATFTLGVPIGSAQPRIQFTNDTETTIEYFSQNGNFLENTISVTASTSGLQCSFAGGCSYEVTAKSLTQMISANSTANFVEVCDEVCVMDESLSTISSVQCKLPKLSTVYSNENFGIATESKDLDSGRYFGTFVDNSIAFDGNLLQTPNSTATGDCQVGMGFKKGHVGMISQVKWYMADMNENTKNLFADSTQFQGSNDQYVNWQTIFTMDQNVHAGWNYHEWTLPADYPKYRFYRFHSPNSGGCSVNEVVFRGVETINNEDATYSCDVNVNIGETETALNTIEYTNTLTTNLASISPRYGPVTGGTSVTFSGTNFPTSTGSYTITLDGINCPVSAANSTSVTCTTGSRPGLVATKTEILITGQGLIANNDLVYTYASAWSDDTTWGGLFSPGEGESIYVPAGLNLLVDLDATPILNAVFVEGSILFVPDTNPSHHRTFDAHYLFITNEGSRMEVGTEEFPYTSKITITMHGNDKDPFLPIFGNKVIGCSECTLDMHGVQRNVTWTYLDSTVEIGATVITLAEVVDWQVGEMIAIAPTGYQSQEGEDRTISAVSNDGTKSTITLDQPLDYKHFAQIQTFGNESTGVHEMDTRAEVGLLSRNVIFRGDNETSKRDQYGAAIFLHSEGDDSLTARLSYIELTDVGQAEKLGRYAIHFHMIGAVYNSYVKGLAIHQSINRAVTMHGVHHLRVENNVIYKTKGHNIFIEDAVETNNYLKDNLIISVKRSWSILNTDQTPAGFWITHPNNHLIGNHIGGSDRYGIWYDLQEGAQGPSSHMGGCPHYSRVGINDNNAAHSVGRYGLRIFHRMEPRTYPCQPMIFDELNNEDPYWQNPPIETTFNNFTSWKNNRDGAIAQFLGWVKFNNFKVADNKEAGIQMSVLTLNGNYSGIFNSLFVGASANADDATFLSAPYGAQGPRSEFWQVRNSSFFNYNWTSNIGGHCGSKTPFPRMPATAFGYCSHCQHHNTRTAGGHLYKVSGIYLDESVDSVINWNLPYNGMMLDEDGSVSEMGPGSWLAGSGLLRMLPECIGGENRYGGALQGRKRAWGVRCNSSAELKSLYIDADIAQPQENLRLNQFQILPYDDSIIGNMNSSELSTYASDINNRGGQFYMREGWSAVLATSHKYRFFFASMSNVKSCNLWGTALTSTSVDWEFLKMGISEDYVKADGSIYMTHTYTDYRTDFNLTKDNVLKENDTIPALPSQYVGGQNFWSNITNQIDFIINGKGKLSPKAPVVFNLTASPEIEVIDIIEIEDDDLPDEDFERLWSDTANWPNGELPKEGEDVLIKPQWNMVLDIAETPVIRLLKVYGRLTFSDEMDVHLHAKHVTIRSGEFNIGSVYEPYQHQAIITLHGGKDENAVLYPGAWSPGTKMIANAGLLQMIGKTRAGNTYFSRLVSEVSKGSTEIFVDTGLDWRQGDRLVIGPTSYGNTAEEAFISAYDSSSGQVNLTEPILFYHWGQAESTGSQFDGVDMRAEVMMMTRSILLKNDIDLGLGNSEPSQDTITESTWSGRIVTSDTAEFLNGQIVARNGQTVMSAVEIYGFGGQDTMEAAINFKNAKILPSSVTNCAIHNSLGWGARILHSGGDVTKRATGLAAGEAGGIVFSNNFIFNVRPHGLVVSYSKNGIVDGNIIMKVVGRGKDTDSYKDREGGIVFGWGDFADDTRMGNYTMNSNIVANARTAAYWARGHSCDDPNVYFVNNTAHSNQGHGTIFRGIAMDLGRNDGKCFAASYFRAYKNLGTAATSFNRLFINLEYHHMTMIDNAKGFMPLGSPNLVYQDTLHTIKMYDNKVYGEYAPMLDCPSDGSFCYNIDKYGWGINGVTHDGRDGIPVMHVLYPYENVMGAAATNQTMIMERNQFFNFDVPTVQGKSQKVLYLNPHQGDYYPIQEWTDTVFFNIAADNLAYLMSPPAGWAVIDDCGLFPCTGPQNVLMNFRDSIFQGITPSYASSDFQLMSNNPEFAPNITNCTLQANMNAYTCENKELGILLFESQDNDKFDRSVSPVIVSQTGSTFNNTMNSFMDHEWDGFYTSQVRLSAFPTLVSAPQGVNTTTDITFTGTPPNKMKFQLIDQSRGSTLGTTIRVAYPNPGTISVYSQGVLVPMNDWDDNIAGYQEVQQSYCGENRFIGLVNILEFYITSGCDLEIKPRNVIQTKVRMDFTLEGFFSSGGTTNFIDRLTASLGIHASDVKIVSVYEGSLVVNYEVSTPDDNPESLSQLESQQATLLSSSTVDLGAPVMEHESSTRIDPDRNFTAAQHEVYEIMNVDQNSAEQIWWESTYITFDYEPIVVIDDDRTVPQTNETSSIEQDMLDRQEAYNNDMIQYGFVEDQTYVPGSIENPEYQASNVAAQNSFDGATVVTQENKVYQDVAVNVEGQPVYKYTTEQTVIVTEKDPEVISLEAEEKSKTLLIPVVFTAIIVIALAICVRQFMVNSKQDQIAQAEMRAQRISHEQELSECKGNVIDLGGALKQNQYDNVARDSIVNSIEVNQKGVADLYSAQYDPNNDFAVFGIGDPTRGGIQSMKEKMNLADNVADIDEDDSEDDSDTARDHQPLPQDSDTKEQSASYAVENLNDLPEDKEIVSDAEDIDV